MTRLAAYLSLIAGLALCPGLGISQSQQQAGAGLTSVQKRDGVADQIKKINKTLDFAMKRLERAKENKDIIQVNCVNDKLTGIRGFLRIAERSQKSLLEALAQRDESLVQHEYSKVAIVGLRVENLKLEVEGCIGELSQYTGNSELTVQVDDAIRQDDPSTEAIAPAFDALNVVRPPAVTGSE